MILDKLSISYILSWFLVLNLLLYNHISVIHYRISLILIECIYHIPTSENRQNRDNRDNREIAYGKPIAKIVWSQAWDHRVNNILSKSPRPIINYQLMYEVTLNFIANYNYELYNNELYNNVYNSSINLNQRVVIGIKI